MDAMASAAATSGGAADDDDMLVATKTSTIHAENVAGPTNELSAFLP